ncbi:hypothetical protein SteCoe_16154 [Stentor coeruleus]|uniref:Uncharacterized protein n=1 Tax=Stentor coeruleus TaxID=5963 RepID=A0A1R2C1S0_9CILI|nr:hypothetical protein SteCoe_16154 [Stentor coeruleus]
MCMLETFFFIIGLNSTLYLFFSALNIVKSILSSNNLSAYGKGSWALITGCTDGIGEGFTETLAKQGFNIIQVSRNPEKLKNQAQDLKAKYGIKVKSICKDFSQCSKDPVTFFNDIFFQTKDLDVSLLINNIGATSNTIKKSFAEVGIDNLTNLITLNLFPIVFLTRIYLPEMNKRTHKSGIINLSSVLADLRLKFNIPYGASKNFDKYFTISIQAENDRKSKVDILCLQPGYVDTVAVRKYKPTILVINRFECAESAMKCLGNVQVTNGHPKHLLMSIIGKIASLGINYLRKN